MIFLKLVYVCIYLKSIYNLLYIHYIDIFLEIYTTYFKWENELCDDFNSKVLNHDVQEQLIK